MTIQCYLSIGVVENLCNNERLEVEYLIPDSLNLNVRADLKGRTLTSSMTIRAPEDRKTAKARVNWLLRQLTKTREDGIHIMAAYGRREDIQAALVKVREDPATLAKDDSKICPLRFEVKLISDLRRKMEGPKTIVQALETHVPEFYTEVGQHLRAWVPSAPRVSVQQEQEQEKENDKTETATAQPVEEILKL